MANPLVEFNDSQLGVVLGSVLHTLGAIAFLGGLVGYLAWHRALTRGHDHRRVLDAAAFLTYLSIVVNLLGGFMRTFQTGHPHLTQWAESPWVRAIAIKHVFLFVGQGAAIYLFERVASRLLKEHKAGGLTKTHPLGHTVAVGLVALGIIVASVLGALTQVVPLVSADAGTGMDPGHDGHNQTAALDVYHNATGQLTSTPLQPAESTGTFVVPNGTVFLQASLSWTPSQSTLRLTVADPEGQAMVGQPTMSATAGGSVTLDVEAPAAGTWTYGVGSDLAVNVAWQLSVRMAQAGNDTVVEGQREILPGRFFEINTEMALGASFAWTWESSEVVYFDVHSHFDGEVQTLVQKDTASDRGEFTNERAGGYSLLWDNTGTLPVTLTYRVVGQFTVHSVVG